MKMFGFLLFSVLLFSACAGNNNAVQETQPSAEPETQILATSETESEFTGNPIIDEADVGNIETVANDVVAADSKIDTTDTAENDNSDMVAAVEEDTESDTDSTDSENEMSQEEAEAELAADMAESDTASLETLPKLTLDMTTAFVPTASRRISAPYGIRTYRMHRGVDMGLCHGEDRTIVAAFAGVVTKVRNQAVAKVTANT